MKKLKMSKSLLSTLGLIMITVWSAVQYLFYSNVPEDISTFAFLLVTNLCGCAVLGLTQFNHMKEIRKSTLKKGAILSVSLLCFNFFTLLGSRNMDSVIISSVISLYFVFVAPLLLLFRRKVSFRSAVATVIALIALLLVFNANIEGVFASRNVIYLVIADVFFAAYIVMVSFMTEGEDSQAMAFVQMSVCAALSLIAWVIEVKGLGHGTMVLSADPKFWVSVLFIGIFIRALYSVVQFAAQKNVPPINASLIFASEIVITLLLNPLLCRLFGTPYEPATIFQAVGCVLFVVAVLICDDEFMRRFNYEDMDVVLVVDEDGNTYQQVPLSRKIVNMNLPIGLGALVVSTLFCLSSIFVIRDSVIESSRTFGNDASASSQTALMKQVEKALSQKAEDKAAVAAEKLDGYRSTVQYAADTAGQLLSHPENYAGKEVLFPHVKNGGIWTMQLTLADESISEDAVRTENEALGNLETLLASIQSKNPNLTTIYVGTADGLLISYDPNSDGTGVYGTPFYYDYRDSEWFTKADGLTEPAFTDTYLDGMGRGLTITCFAPIYYEDGSFAGSIGMDFLQQELNEQLVNVGIRSPETAALISANGTVIATTGESLTEEEAVTIMDKDSGLPLSPVAVQILSQASGLLVSNVEDNSYYIAYNKVAATGWKLCIISPVDNIIAPAVRIRNNIEGNTEKIGNAVTDGVRNIIAWCLIFFAVIVLLITYFVGKLSVKITDPLKHLEKDVLAISQGEFDRRTTVDTRDEIGNLARAFNGMTANLQNSISELTEATAREERIASELNLATKIQADSLPSDYPAFPGRDEFDLFFSMNPAKEVGGDFYDFFLIDESHLGMVIADVSGKGVPACLFMMISKTLIKNRAILGGTPGEILTFVNRQLCENNKSEMFVTAWLGILDLETGLLTASNAGHEYPAIRRNGGKYELFKDRHGLVLAGFEASRYRDYTIQLESGDMLFVYTDGVPEANNPENELLGTDRMLDALNAYEGKDCRETIEAVISGISDFVGEAPQFDDTTMLCLRLDKLME